MHSQILALIVFFVVFLFLVEIPIMVFKGPDDELISDTYY